MPDPGWGSFIRSQDQGRFNDEVVKITVNNKVDICCGVLIVNTVKSRVEIQCPWGHLRKNGQQFTGQQQVNTPS